MKIRERSMVGRLRGAAMNKQKKYDAISKAEVWATGYVGSITDRELVLLVAGLYWAEGAKADQTTGFQFINSDPAMICCVQKGLSLLGVTKEELFCTVQINESHRYRIDEVLNFWEKLLGLKSAQIGNPYFIRAQRVKVYANSESYFGTCRLIVRKSTGLKYKILGLIKALKNDILMPM